jgi:hypothetical protein
MSEIEFVTENTYVFTGSIYQIERKTNVILPEKKELLGRFITYIDIRNHKYIFYVITIHSFFFNNIIIWKSNKTIFKFSLAFYINITI